MRVVLEVVAGPEAGRKVLLRSRHVVRVGRTAWADFVCERDEHMSGLHFKVLTDRAGCYLEDMGSSNGTFVNGERVEGRRLTSGDRVHAGQSVFLVEIEGDNPGEVGSYVFGDAAVSATGGAPRPTTIQFTVEECPSGVILYQFDQQEISPSGLCEKLAEKIPLWLLVDWNRAGQAPPLDLHNVAPLVNWLGDELGAIYPSAFGAADTADWQDVVDAGWPELAIIGVFSRVDRTAFVESWRKRMRGPGRSSLYGFCWTDVLATHLNSAAPADVERTLAGHEACLTLRPEQPDKLKLYGRGSLESVLQECGFERRAAAAVAPTNPATAKNPLPRT